MYKVMLIDDEPWILKDLREIFNWNELGFEIVAEAGKVDGAEAIIARYQPDLIISDIRMPGMSGLELMSRIKRKYSDTLVVFISAHSEFDYAKQAIQMGAFDYILKPAKAAELEEVLKKAWLQIVEINRVKDKIRQFDNIQMLLDVLESKKSHISIKKQLSRSGFIPEQDDYAFAIIKKLENGDVPNMSFWQECIMSGLPRSGCLPVRTSEGKWVFLMHFSADTTRRHVKNTFRRLNEMTNVHRLTVGLSQPFTDLGKLKIYYMQAEIMADQDFMTSRPGVYPYSSRMPQLKKVIHQVKAASGFRELLSLTEQLPEWVRQHRIDLAGLAQLYNEVMLCKARLEGRAESEAELVHAEEIVYSFDHLEQLAESLHTSLDNSQKETPHTLSSSMIRKMVEDILCNFHRKLTLHDIAAQYHVHPNYLSQLFKQETGKSFTHFLIELRINKAIELLREDQPLYAISEQVGYDDYFHFCKLFKKHKGMTPSQYRKHI